MTPSEFTTNYQYVLILKLSTFKEKISKIRGKLRNRWLGFSSKGPALPILPSSAVFIEKGDPCSLSCQGGKAAYGCEILIDS